VKTYNDFLLQFGVSFLLAVHPKNYMYLAALTNNIMATGTVKFFNESKGFGFITPTNGGKEVFVHVTGLIDQIRENDEVTYDVEEGKKGPSAVNVKIV
jgi:cold shock protein